MDMRERWLEALREVVKEHPEPWEGCAAAMGAHGRYCWLKYGIRDDGTVFADYVAEHPETAVNRAMMMLADDPDSAQH